MDGYRITESGRYRLDLLRQAIGKAQEDHVMQEDTAQRLLAWIDQPETRKALSLPHPAYDEMQKWQYADCSLCGRRITKNVSMENWFHVDYGTGQMMVEWSGRGCRAASWRNDGEWDETYHRDWMADPQPDSISDSVGDLINDDGDNNDA